MTNVTLLNPMGGSQQVAHLSNETVAQFCIRAKLHRSLVLVHLGRVLPLNAKVPSGARLNLVPGLQKPRACAMDLPLVSIALTNDGPDGCVCPVCCCETHKCRCTVESLKREVLSERQNNILLRHKVRHLGKLVHCTKPFKFYLLKSDEGRSSTLTLTLNVVSFLISN